MNAYNIRTISKDSTDYSTDWGTWYIYQDDKCMILSSEEAQDLFNQLKPNLYG